MINVVKYKTSKGYNDAIKAGNTSNSVILQTHEPFRIIVFSDAKPVKRDARIVSRVTEIEDQAQIPTGNALLAINAYNEDFLYDEHYVTEAYKLINKNKIKVLEDIKLAQGYIVEIPDGMTFSRLNSLLNKSFDGRNIFSVIEEDMITQAESCDYYAWPYNSQWHLDDIDALNAYDLLDNGNYNSEEGVTYGEWHTRDVAILDGHGFEFTHPDLDNNDYPNNHPGRYMTRNNWDCVLNNNNPQPAGTNDKHGTVMAGIAASGWADRRFLRGVGLDHVNAQCLRIGYNVSQTGTFSTATSIVVRALNKAAINGNCASIVMPYSGLFYSPFTNHYLRQIRLFGRYGKGMPIFAASGNNGLNGFSNVYPASYNDVMAIGASTQTNTKAAFSNYGADLFATAPGVSIFAIDRCCGRGYNINPDSTYGSVTYFTGTSASSVIAATIAATMVVAYPDITELKVRNLLAMTARRLGPYTYNSESNEIGLNLGISNEMGNGILTQADAIQAALDMLDADNANTVNYAINDFYINWRTVNEGPWYTEQPIPAGVWLRGEVNFSITNNGSSVIFAADPWPISMLVTLEEGGPVPTDETLMQDLTATFASWGSGAAINPGETVEFSRVYNVSAQLATGSCGLDGDYYLVARIDNQNAISETSEEDNFRAEPVQFTMDHPSSVFYCLEDPTSVLGLNNLSLCFYDTGSTIPGYGALGDPNYFVLSEDVSYTNLFPVNESLQINTLIPTRIGNSNSWNIYIYVTNLGTSPIQQFSVRYEFNPGVYTAIFGSTYRVDYLGRNNHGFSCSPDDTNHINLSYNDSYPEALSAVYPLPSSSNPILPGQGRGFNVTREFSPMFFPTILTARITVIDYRNLFNPTQSIHVAQSNIIYG
jgi:hypothetical protein